jgi:hypothetical protein
MYHVRFHQSDRDLQHSSSNGDQLVANTQPPPSTSSLVDAVLAILNMNNDGVRLLVNSAARILLYCSKLFHLKKKGKKGVDKLAEVAGDNKYDALIREVMAQPLIKDLLTRYFSLLDLLTDMESKQSSLSDEYVETYVAINSFNADYFSDLVYPGLFAFSSQFMAVRSYMPLSRQAISMAPPGCNFLLATSKELVYYNSASSLFLGHGPNAIRPLRAEPLQDSSTQETTVGDATTNSNAPTDVSYLNIYDVQHFLNILADSVSLSPIVRTVVAAEAGGPSSSFFSAHLLDDAPRSGLSFRAVLDLVADMVQKSELLSDEA